MANREDINVLARTIWGEARGEGFDGMVAVAWTIRNRVDMDLGNDGKADWWGEGYVGVCKAPWQFSCWNKSDPNYPYMVGDRKIPPNQLLDCERAALAAISGSKKDPTKGATHYYSTTMSKPPKWASHGTPTVTIGRHVFFKDVK